MDYRKLPKGDEQISVLGGGTSRNLRNESVLRMAASISETSAKNTLT